MSDQSWKLVIDEQKSLTNLRLEHWLHYEIFTPQWFLLLALLIIPWFIYWKFADRKRFKEIFIYGLLLVVIVMILDGIGVELNWWDYPIKLFPIVLRLYSIDLSLLPILYMLIYQYYVDWKSFIIASILASAIYSFIGEPVLVWLKVYELYNWEHAYSFPIYILLAVFLKWLVKVSV